MDNDLKNWEKTFNMLKKWEDWEEVPDEDLFEDGELDTVGVAIKIYSKVCRLGDWKLLRRKNG